MPLKPALPAPPPALLPTSHATGATAAAPLDTQALALLLLLRSGATHQLLPKLAAYVADPSGSGSGPATTASMSYWATPRLSYIDQALVTAALAEYDRAVGSAQPAVNVTAVAAGVTVLRVRSCARVACALMGDMKDMWHVRYVHSYVRAGGGLCCSCDV